MKTMLDRNGNIKKWHEYAFLELVLTLIFTFVAALLTVKGLRTGTIIEGGFLTSKLLNFIPFWGTLALFEFLWISCFFLGILLDRFSHSTFFAFAMMSGLLVLRIVDVLNDIAVTFFQFSLQVIK